MTWKAAFIKTKWKALLFAILSFIVGGYLSDELLAVYWGCLMVALYLMAVYATKKKWRGFV